MNNLEIAALQAILNRILNAKKNYDNSNNKQISDGCADTYWGIAEDNINEAIDLLQQCIKT